MSSLTRPTLQRLTLAFVVGLATILTAWGFQIFADLVPCPLCLLQRWPYYIGLPLLLVAMLLLMRSPSSLAGRTLVGLTAIVFLTGAGLGAFHAGVEWGWWPGPTTCAAGAALPEGAGNLMAQMQATRVVPCDEAAWRLFGISMAGYNALISLLVAVLLAWWLAETKRPGDVA